MSERVQILGANGKPLPPSTGSFFRTERGRCQGAAIRHTMLQISTAAIWSTGIRS